MHGTGPRTRRRRPRTGSSTSSLTRRSLTTSHLVVKDPQDQERRDSILTPSGSHLARRMTPRSQTTSHLVVGEKSLVLLISCALASVRSCSQRPRSTGTSSMAFRMISATLTTTTNASVRALPFLMDLNLEATVARVRDLPRDLARENKVLA